MSMRRHTPLANVSKAHHANFRLATGETWVSAAGEIFKACIVYFFGMLAVVSS
jgi:hypothetical protein